MQTRTDDRIALAVLAVLVLGAVGYGALHVVGSQGDLDEVTVFPVGLTCSDGADGDDEAVDVPLVERAQDFPDEDPPAEPTQPGYVVSVRDDSALACTLEVGVTNGGDGDVHLDGIDVGGWAPGPVSTNPWEVDRGLSGDVEVQDTTARFRFDEEVAAGAATSVTLSFRQRDAARLRDDGLEWRHLGVDVSAWGASRTVQSGFTLVTVMGDRDGTP